MNRRQFFQALAVAVPAIASLKIMATEACSDFKSKLAKVGTQSYVLNASEAKAKKASGDKKYSNYADAQSCVNCKWYGGGPGKKNAEVCEGHGKCSMVGGKWVAAEGWCKMYKPLPGAKA